MKSNSPDDKISELESCLQSLGNSINFARSLIDQYHRKHFLSDKQWFYVDKLLNQAGQQATESTSSAAESSGAQILEVFNGTKLRDLFIKVSKKLKYPKLRYQTDGGSKIVFSYAVNPANLRWKGATFIDNGQKFPNKTRYGRIDSNGHGYLDRTSQQSIKTAIRKVADNPTESAILQGQAYKNCCFCGLELTNKSSLYHGYGPICAGNWGLPWGDTGDKEADEAAAVEELKHIQLQDLE